MRSQSFQHCAQFANLVGAVGRAGRRRAVVVVLMARLAAGVLLMIGPGQPLARLDSLMRNRLWIL